MFKKSNILLLGLAVSAIFLCGCMSVDCVMTETFEPTEKVEKFDKVQEIPHAYTVIGVCQTEGNYTEFSYDDMMDRIEEKARENGADGILMVGMRVVPDGRVVQTSPLRDTLDGSSTGNQWGEISKSFGGGYGSIRSKSYGASQTYDRIIRVQFIRYKRDAKGEFLPPLPPEKLKDPKGPVKTLKELKKENKNARAN